MGNTVIALGILRCNQLSALDWLRGLLMYEAFQAKCMIAKMGVAPTKLQESSDMQLSWTALIN